MKGTVSLLSVLILLAAVLPTARAETTIDDFEARVFRFCDPPLIPYRLYVPQNYNPANSYPLILFLHGMGGQGYDNTSQIELGATTLVENLRDTPNDCFVVAPQMPPVQPYNWNQEGLMPRVIGMIGYLRREFNIDPHRMYVTGVSMGGNGAYYAGDYYGEYFAASVPIAGWYSTSRASAFVEKPLWIWHGALDGTVSVSSDRAMYAAILALGGPVLYTEYPYGAHVIWPAVYSESSLYAWLFAQTLPTDPPAAPGPELAFEKTDLGDGLYGWTFSIANDDGLLASYAATLSFYTQSGTTLTNVQANGMDINDEPTADFVSQFGFDKDRDTYSLTPFVNTNALPGNSILWGNSFTGYREGANFWEMSVGTGAGSQHGDATPVAYVVADGNVSWIGTIARDNFLYITLGATDLPPTGTILGDYTGNGVVDQADYTLWADNFGNMCSSVFAPGSYAEPDHAINTPEYTTWADHFGNTASQTLGMTQSIVPVGAAEPMLVTGGAAEGDYNNDGKVDLADYTVWADSFIQTDNAPALEAVQSQTPAVEEEPAEELTPAQTRREKMQARRAELREARKARLEARRQAQLERLNNR